MAAHDETVEKVAEAIYLATINKSGGCAVWPKLEPSGVYATTCRNAARAAIAALGETQVISSAVEVCPDCDIAGCKHIRARQQTAGDGWQDIASAPRDGRDVLVHTLHGLRRVAFWDEARGGLWSLWPGREPAEPTHWRPLPPPPGAKP